MMADTNKKDAKRSDPAQGRWGAARQNAVFSAECELLDLLSSLDYPSFASMRSVKRSRSRRSIFPSTSAPARRKEQEGAKEPRSDSFSTQFRTFPPNNHAADRLSITEVAQPLSVAVSNNSNICELLRALEELPEGFGGSGEITIIVPAHAVAEHDEVKDALDALVDAGANLLFDENASNAILRSKPCSTRKFVTRSKLFAMSDEAVFTGDSVDQELLFTVYRNKFIDEVDLAWGRLVVSDAHAADPPLRSIEQRIAFARLLSLGSLSFDNMARRAKSAKWKADALKMVEFPSDLASGALSETARELEQLSNIKRAWIESAALVGAKLVVERDELTEGDDDLPKRIRFLAECFGVDALVDAMNKGLPMDDLLCAGLSKLW